MARTYRQTLESLYARVRFGERPGLEGPRRLDERLGFPSRAMPGLIIGGTNGKGSTAAFVEALLRQTGHRTGLFTSPHLFSFRERIRIGGLDVSETEVVDAAAIVERACDALGYDAPFFEVVWAMAATIFRERQVDVAIWEVGLGGRLDATNAGEPCGAAITSIGLDHTKVLGETVEAIAREKAGICRPDRPLIVGARGPGGDALRSLLESADVPRASSVRTLGKDFFPVVPDVGRELPLSGAHQRDNAAVALELARVFEPRVGEVGLDWVRRPGRFERFGDGLILDCAHNPDGAVCLAETVRALVSGPLDLIFGAMSDKDFMGVIGPLLPLARSVHWVVPDHPRAASPLASIALHGVALTSGGTVTEALSQRRPDGTTLVFGSCFLVGEARAGLEGREYPELGLHTVAR